MYIRSMRWCHRFARHHFRLEHVPANSEAELTALSAALPFDLSSGANSSSELAVRWTRWLHQTRSPLFLTMSRWRRRQMPRTNQTERELRLIERMSHGISDDLQLRLANMSEPPQEDPIVPDPVTLTPPRLEDVDEETSPLSSPVDSPSTTE